MKKLPILTYTLFFIVGVSSVQAQDNIQVFSLYGGFNFGTTTIKLTNKDYNSIEQFSIPGPSTGINWGGQIGVQIMGLKPERTILGFEYSKQSFQFSRNFENIPIDNDLSYHKSIDYFMIEHSLGFRYIRVVPTNKNRILPFYGSIHYNLIRPNGIRSMNTHDLSSTLYNASQAFKPNSNGFMVEAGLYFKYIDFGIGYTHYGSVFSNGKNELNDNFFDNKEYNESFTSSTFTSKTSFSSLQLKIRLNLFAFSILKCSDGKKQFNTGSPYYFEEFWILDL